MPVVTSTVETKVVNEVLFVTINRPDVMNALSQEVVAQLIEIFESHAKPSQDVRAIVLRGAGGNFCGGGDIKEMFELIKKSNDGDLEAVALYNQGAGDLYYAMRRAGVPVIAAVEGVALGGGLGLACAADITVATKNAVFGLPETGLGVIPAQVSPFIRRRVGESQARLMAVLGGKFDAAKAEKAGVVHYLVEDAVELESTIESLLKKLKACAPNAAACAKELMMEDSQYGDYTPSQLGMLFAEQMVSEEGKEGTGAFVQKRKPNWCR